MGENVIREANQKSEEILHRANLRGDDIIRDANELLQKANDRADEIENEANEKRLAEEREYDRVRLEVTRFKSDVLNLYRSHVESLSRLPEFQKETAAQDAEQAEPAAAGFLLLIPNGNSYHRRSEPAGSFLMTPHFSDIHPPTHTDGLLALVR